MISPMTYVSVGTSFTCTNASCEQVSSTIYKHGDTCPAHEKCHEKAMHYLDGNFYCGFCLEPVNPKTLLTDRQIEQIIVPAFAKVDTALDGFLNMVEEDPDAVLARELWEVEIGYGSPNERDD